MSFNIEKMVDFAEREIARFAPQHANETFYAFAIDASLLCLNSVEAFEASLKEYKARYPKYYETDSQIEDLRQNTGDWEYQGFASFSKQTGFDKDAYDEHYNLGLDCPLDEMDRLNNTSYAKAMGAVIEALKKRDAFKSLKCSNDFYATQVEHNY
jgi:hypothetical protein